MLFYRCGRACVFSVIKFPVRVADVVGSGKHRRFGDTEGLVAALARGSPRGKVPDSHVTGVIHSGTCGKVGSERHDIAAR